jgi:hypothetical protein
LGGAAGTPAEGDDALEATGDEERAGPSTTPLPVPVRNVAMGRAFVICDVRA